MCSHLRSCPIQLSRRTEEPKGKNLEANVGFLGFAEGVAMTFRKEMYLQRPGRSSASEGILQRNDLKVTPQTVTFNVS